MDDRGGAAGEVPAGPAPSAEARPIAHAHVLHGSCSLTGLGLDTLVTLDDAMTFEVAGASLVRLTSFSGGNSSSELVLVVVLCAGTPVRYFPLGARSDVRLHLDREDALRAGALTVAVAAPQGASGEVVVDLHLARVAAPAAA